MGNTAKNRKSWRAFDMDFDIAPAGPPSFKDALFVLEMGELSEDLKVCAEIVREFKKTAEASTTYIEMSTSVDDACQKIDTFKNRNCGSAFSIALINLNLFEALD